MPRRKRRFSFLERALKAAGGTATAGRLKNYADFKAGINKANVGTIPTAARKRVGYGILPFGLDSPATPTAANFYKIAISEFSNNWRVGKLSNADLGYDTTNYANATSDDGFYPAVAKMFVPTSETAVSVISGITKDPYKRLPGSTYSIPFGSHVTDDARSSEFEQRNAIAEAVTGAPVNARSISFLPEQLNKVRPEPGVGT